MLKVQNNRYFLNRLDQKQIDQLFFYEIGTSRILALSLFLSHQKNNGQLCFGPNNDKKEL